MERRDGRIKVKREMDRWKNIEKKEMKYKIDEWKEENKRC